MITVILAGALAVSTFQQQVTDTTFEVDAGGRLSIESLNGSVRVGSWDRSAMRVRALHGPGIQLDIDRRSSRVDIDVEHHYGPTSVQFEITVPRTYNIDVEGVNLPTTIDDVRGRVTVENVEGALIVRNVVGDVVLESVGGSIAIENVQGRVSVSNVNQTIRLSGVQGNIDAEAVNGSIVMRGIDARRVEASTLNGQVEYNGTIYDNGIYNIATHNGRIMMAVPGNANATIHIETYNGKVDTAFPVRVRTGSDREFTISLGSGTARINLESHNGTISLVRPTQ